MTPKVTELALALPSPLPPQRGGGGGGGGFGGGGQLPGASTGGSAKMSKTAWIAVIGTLGAAATAIAVLVARGEQLPGEVDQRLAEQIALQNQTNSTQSTQTKASVPLFGF